MNVLYIGDFHSSNGPATVNKEIISRLTCNYSICQSNEWKGVIFHDLYNLIRSDVIHVSAVSFKGLLFFLLSFIFNKKRVFLMHGSLIIESKFKRVSKFRLLFEKYLIYLCTELVVVSDLLKDKALQLYKCAKSKNIEVIPNGSIVRNCNVHLSSASFFNRKFDITTVGGGRAEKNILKICELLDSCDLSSRLTLHVFGEDGFDTEKIRAFPFVVYHGFVSPQILSEYVKNTKVFIQYSEFDSFSIAALDSLVVGCRLIVSECVGLKDYIEHSNMKVIGFERAELLGAIDSSLYKDGYKKFELPKYLSWEQIVEQYEKLWLRVVER